MESFDVEIRLYDIRIDFEMRILSDTDDFLLIVIGKRTDFNEKIIKNIVKITLSQ